MIICEECRKQVKKKVFCCDACRQRHTYRYQKTGIDRQSGHFPTPRRSFTLNYGVQSTRKPQTNYIRYDTSDINYLD